MSSSSIVVLRGPAPDRQAVGVARLVLGRPAGRVRFAIGAALDKAGLSGEQIDYVYMGHVLQPGAGQITARQAAANGGIPMSVPATTVNKVCLSGMDAVYRGRPTHPIR